METTVTGGDEPARDEAGWVLLASGDGIARVGSLPASGEVVIGRDPACGLVLDHERVSRRHARLVRVAVGGSSITIDDPTLAHPGSLVRAVAPSPVDVRSPAGRSPRSTRSPRRCPRRAALGPEVAGSSRPSTRRSRRSTRRLGSPSRRARYQWLENADDTHTIRKYTFKGNNYKVTEKTYLTEAKAYKGCK